MYTFNSKYIIKLCRFSYHEPRYFISNGLIFIPYFNLEYFINSFNFLYFLLRFFFLWTFVVIIWINTLRFTQLMIYFFQRTISFVTISLLALNICRLWLCFYDAVLVVFDWLCLWFFNLFLLSLLIILG